MRPYILLAVGLLLCCAAIRAVDKNDETVQRVTTHTLGMPITRVDTVSVRDLKISGFIGSSFEITKAPKAPFQLLSSQNQPLIKGLFIRIDSGVVLVRVAFSPIVWGAFRDEIILQRRPPVSQTSDEILVIVEGFSFVPSRTMHVEFGGVLVGDTVRRIVRVPEDIVATSTWSVVRPELPFFLVDSIPKRIEDPDAPGKFITAFMLEFMPLVKGPKKGQATFVRRRLDNSTRILDTLIVSMSGNGEELLPRASIDFGRLMVGDSAERIAAVPIRGIGNTVYKPISVPSGNSPFRYIRANHVGDELLIAVSFSPPVKPPFSYRDSVVLYRIKEGRPDPLDSLVCILFGAAGQMQSSTEIEFADQRIGRLDSADVQLAIPIQFELRSFSYYITPDSTQNARVWGEVGQPDPMPSKSQKLTFNIFSKPNSLGTHFETLYLVRKHDTVGVIDSTAIYVTSVVKPRPVKLRASITREIIGANNQPKRTEDSVMSARIGDTVIVAILAKTEDPIDLGLVFTTVRCSLAYNPTVLVPIIGPGDNALVIGDSAVFAFGSPEATTQPIETSGRVIARASFVVVMGDADNSPLTMTGLSLQPDTLIEAPELDNATVRITNVWSYQDGRSRLINPFQKSLGLDVSPNPASSVSIITVANVPSGEGKLQIVSSEGVVMVDYTPALREGTRDFGFPTLSRGVYFVRLMAKGQAGSSGATINSVVRLVIVE